MHQAVKISPQQDDDSNGLGLVVSQDIPKGSLLIALPDHVPLRFESDGGDEAQSVLVNLARQVPGLFFELFLIYLIIYELILLQSFVL